MSEMLVEAHASTLSRWFYCSQQCLFQLHGVYPPSTKAHNRGTEIHKWATSRPKSPREQGVWNALQYFKVESKFKKGQKYFHRQLRNFDIFGDIDDFRLHYWNFIIIEVKTTAGAGLDWFYASPYIFQVQIYAWILKPLLPKIIIYRPFQIASQHEIHYLSSKDSRPIDEPIYVPFHEAVVERNLNTIIDTYNGTAQPIPPKPYKCTNCHYRNQCPIPQKPTPLTPSPI